MRVLLLNPPPARGINVVREGRCMERAGTWATVWPPLSLATSAAVLRQAGFAARVVDGVVEEIDHDGLARFVSHWHPDLVVINTATASIETDLGLGDLVKDAWPLARTAAMGIHVSALPAESLDMAPGVDMVVRGEPEYTIRDAAAALAQGADLEALPGLSWRDGPTLVHNLDRPFISDLDELPFPAWDLVDTGRYRMPISGKPFLLLATARGCSHSCTFCASQAYYGAFCRWRSPGRIVDEMQWAVEELGIGDFLLWSESFTSNQEYAIKTAEEMIRRGLDVNWVCNSRVDTVSPELLAALREAGCWMIGYGIESGNQDVLDSVQKETTLDQTVEAVRMTREAGLKVAGHCMLGFPGETPATMRQTVEFARFLKLDYAQFNCVVAFPGSLLYEQCRREGWLEDSEWKYYEQNYSVITTSGLKAGQVMEARGKAVREYYRQPRVVLGTLGNIRSPRDVTNLARTAWEFLS